MSGSMLLSFSLRVFVEVLAALTMSLLVNYVHASLLQMLQRRFCSITLLLSMWYTMCARASKDPFLPVYSWCKVFPILPFFLFEIFSVAESASRSVFSDSCLEIKYFHYFVIPHLSLLTILSLLLSLIFHFVSTYEILCTPRFSGVSRIL